VGILSLLGLSFAEKRNLPKNRRAFLPPITFPDAEKVNANEIFKFIFRGAFPALSQHNAPPLEVYYNSYLQTYLDRDLKEMYNISNLSAFHTFLQLCAARTGQILNYSDLARDAGISVNAAREWTGILETSGQIYLLRPYFSNISKRLIKSPKLYFLDTGLAAYLTKWKTPEILSGGAMAGAFFETFVVGEIIKSYLFRGQEPPVYYFRDKERHEVDVLIEANNILYPVEIKMSSAINSPDLAGINYLRKLKSVASGKGAVISLSPNHLPADRNNDIVPVWLIN
jgi:hypothetical protein